MSAFVRRACFTVNLTTEDKMQIFNLLWIFKPILFVYVDSFPVDFKRTVNLLPELSVFSNCAVDIIQTELDADAYMNELSILHFAVIRSRYVYQQTSTGPLVCNGDQRHKYILKNETGSFPRALPMPRILCHVKVYIDPPRCNQWTMSYTGNYIWKLDSDMSLAVLPISHTDAVIYSDIGYLTLKTFWYFIRVGWEDLNSAASNSDNLLLALKFRGIGRWFSNIIAVELRLGWNEETNEYVCKQGDMLSFNKFAKNIHDSTLSSGCQYGNLTCELAGFEKYAVIQRRKINISSCFNLQCFPGLMQGDQNGLLIILFKEEDLSSRNYLINNLMSTIFPNSTYAYINTLMAPVSVSPMVHMVQKGQWDPVYDLPPGVALYFLSCTSIRKQGEVSFIGFISAFDWETWVLVCISYISTIMCLWMVYQSVNFNISTFPVQLFVDHGWGNCRVPKSILMAWAFSIILLNVQYRGKNIDRLTSQLPPMHFDTLLELVDNNFTLYSPMSTKTQHNLKTVVYTLKRHEFRKSGNVFRPNSSELDTEYLHAKLKEIPRIALVADKIPNWYSLAIKKALDETSGNKLLNRIPRLLYKPRSMEEWIDWNPKTIANHIGSCNNSALIANFHTIAEINSILKEQLTYSEYENIHISSKPALTTFTSIIFLNIPGHPEPLQSRRRSVAQSGLLHVWSKWKGIYSLNQSVKKHLREFSGRKEKAESPQILTMKSNIRAVYWVWLSMCVVAASAFVTEIFRTLTDGCQKKMAMINSRYFKTVILDVLKQTKLCLMYVCRTVSRKIFVKRLHKQSSSTCKRKNCITFNLYKKIVSRRS